MSKFILLAVASAFACSNAFCAVESSIHFNLAKSENSAERCGALTLEQVREQVQSAWIYLGRGNIANAASVLSFLYRDLGGE